MTSGNITLLNKRFWSEVSLFGEKKTLLVIDLSFLNEVKIYHVTSYHVELRENIICFKLERTACAKTSIEPVNDNILKNPITSFL